MRRDPRSREPQDLCSPEESRSDPSDKVLAKALRLLAARPRSERQLRDRLSVIAGQTDLADQCIERLKDMGLVNDRNFAESFASHRLSSKAMGRSRLARELGARKVDPGAIREALDSVFDQTGEEELIDRAISKWLRSHGRPKDPRDAKRVFDHLLRLGFRHDLIVARLPSLTHFESDS